MQDGTVHEKRPPGKAGPASTSASQATPQQTAEPRRFGSVNRSRARCLDFPRTAPDGRTVVQVAVGTFNLNNLFSRFDFEADVSTAAASNAKVEEQTSFSFDNPSGFKLRTYLGKLVKGKPDAERKLLATRI